jgi:signal transduction histidine kinase/CheY-like chemotaxis protein
LIIVRHNISKPLQLLTDTINAFTSWHKVEETEFEKDLIGRHDELGRMSRSFNRLKHDLWMQGQDLKEAKDVAERASRAKSVFLASASHDLRQPLNAMQMYIAALQLKLQDEEALKIVKDINAVSVSTSRLLNALLDVSQLEAGAITPQVEEIPVQDVLRRVFRSFAPVAREKGLELRLVNSSAFVRSDPVLLERIIGNFTSNAIRYTEQGAVLIGCRRRGAYISIEVVDTGCGILQSQIVSVFEDFYQINNKERDRGKGLGLGLAIAKRLSVCLGHELECSSILGKGSRFAVLVEACEGRVGQPENDALDMVMKGLTGTRILLIEDDIDVLKATRQLLESWGCMVYFGRNVDQVLSVTEGIKETPPDMIVADSWLPGNANGVEVVNQVREMLGVDIPAVIVTGDMDEGYIREITEMGFPVLSKPVQPAKLRATISHMATARSQQEA